MGGGGDGFLLAVCFTLTDYHYKAHDYLSFHLCFSSKCLKALTKTCEIIDLLV